MMERKSYMEEQSIISLFVVVYVLLLIHMDCRTSPLSSFRLPSPCLFLSVLSVP